MEDKKNKSFLATKAGGWTVIIAIPFLIIAFLYSISKPPSPTMLSPTVPPVTTVDIYSSARGACLLALKEILNDPYSADFGMTRDWYIEGREDGTILVQPSVRAKNAFGAYIKSTWNCIVKHEGKNVTVLSLKQIRP